jgi:hypothetical protein
MQKSGGIFICKDETRISVKKVTGSTLKNNENFYVLFLDEEGVSREIEYSNIKEARPLGLDFELPTRRDEAPEEHVEDEAPEEYVEDEAPEEHVEAPEEHVKSVYDNMVNISKMKKYGGVLVLNDGRRLTIDPVLKAEEGNVFFRNIIDIDGESFDDIENAEFNSIEDINIKQVSLLAIKEAIPRNLDLIDERPRWCYISPEANDKNQVYSSGEESDGETQFKKRKRFVVPLLDDDLEDILTATKERNYELLEQYYKDKQRVEITSRKIPSSIYSILYMFKTEAENFAIVKNVNDDIFHMELSELFVVKPFTEIRTCKFFQEYPVHISRKYFWNLEPLEGEDETCFIHKKTGVLLSLEDNTYYFQGIYGNETYTEEEWVKIKDWVSACGISLLTPRKNHTELTPELPKCDVFSDKLSLPDFYKVEDFERIVKPYIENCFAIVVNGETIYNTFSGGNHKERIVGTLIKSELLRDFHNTLMTEIMKDNSCIDVYYRIDYPIMLRAEYYKDNNCVKLKFFTSIEEYAKESTEEEEEFSDFTDFETDDCPEEENTSNFEVFEIGNIVSFMYKDEPKKVLVKVANDKYVEGICQESNTYKKYLVSFIENPRSSHPSTPIKKREYTVPMAPRKKTPELTYRNMILEAIKTLRVNGTRGVSRPAIEEYLKTKFNKYNTVQTRTTLRKLLEEGYILQDKQKFKLADKGKDFFKVSRKLEFDYPQEEVKPTKGPIKGKLTIIDEAIKDDKILDIIYNGGSISGVKRPIRPLRIFQTYKGKSILEATCLIEDATRRFIIDNLTIA